VLWQVLWAGPANVSNHWVLVTVGSAGLLLHAAAARRPRHPGLLDRGLGHGLDREALFADFAPTGRLVLLVLCFYAVLHKCNADYLYPAWSCATNHYASIRRTLPLLPDHPAALQLTIWGSLLVETAIPVLLVVRRTRVAGIALAMMFHTLLALNPDHTFFDFSSTVFALYFLFLPVDFVRGWRVPRWAVGRTARRARRVACGAAAAALVAVLLLHAAPAERSLGYEVIQQGARVLWVLFALGLLAVYLRAARRRDLVGEVRRADGLRPARAWAWAFPALLLAHGATPYLGLKTESSFAMFSNLRTEGERWNHVLVPPTVKRWHYQDDLVTVLASSDRRLARLATRGERYPYFQFRVLTDQAPNAAVTYERGGHVTRVARIAGVPELAHGPGRLERWLLNFRPVPPAGVRTACRH